MEIKVLSFGKLAQVTGSQFVVKEPVNDTDSFQKHILQQFPGLQGLHYRLAVDKQVINENVPLSSNSTIALLPPFSGG